MKRFVFTLSLFLLAIGCDGFLNEQELEEPVWVGIANAERQCITPDFASLEDAEFQLKQNQIPVLNSREILHGTCSACSCPTGVSYQALINKQFLEKAEDLGWQRVD